MFIVGHDYECGQGSFNCAFIRGDFNNPKGNGWIKMTDEKAGEIVLALNRFVTECQIGYSDGNINTATLIKVFRGQLHANTTNKGDKGPEL